MNKEEYYKRIEDKMDKQTKILTNIQLDVVKEFSLIKLAHQKLKYGMIGLTMLVSIILYTEYPKLGILLKKFM